MRNKSRFRYYNANGKDLELEDCVTRAIKTATYLNYNAVANLLDLTADMYNCERLCVCCYHNLLEDILCYKPHYCNNKEKVKDIAKKHNDRRVIIRIKQHLTCSIYGNILDLWDCENEYVDCYWLVN